MILYNLQFDRGNILGWGAYYRIFHGTFKDEKVAVKRVQLLDSSGKRELENNQKLSRLNHPNIVQFKHYQEDDNFR